MREHGTPEHGTPEHGTPEHGWAASAASMPASKRVANPSPSGDRFLPTGLPASERHALSERELEIVELVATGLTNQEIAAQLMISKRTVDNHVSNIFTKTGAKNRVALLNWAMDNGKICRDGFNCCALPSES